MGTCFLFIGCLPAICLRPTSIPSIKGPSIDGWNGMDGASALIYPHLYIIDKDNGRYWPSHSDLFIYVAVEGLWLAPIRSRDLTFNGFFSGEVIRGLKNLWKLVILILIMCWNHTIPDPLKTKTKKTGGKICDLRSGTQSFTKRKTSLHNLMELVEYLRFLDYFLVAGKCYDEAIQRKIANVNQNQWWWIVPPPEYRSQFDQLFIQNQIRLFQDMKTV